MGRTLVALCAGFLALSGPGQAWAQDDEEVVPKDERPVPNDERPVPKDEQPAPRQRETTAPPPAVEAQANSAPLRRHGWFLQGDLGAYLSLSGTDVDINTGEVSDSIGNIQPMAGLTAGYDVFHNSKNNLSLGLRFSATFNASAAQIPDDAQSGQSGAAAFTFPADVEFFQLGAAVDYTYFLGERVGIKLHGDGGIALVSPNPDVALAVGGPISIQTPNDEEGAGARQIGVTFSGGLGVEYYTRLNGFSIGFNTAFYGVVNDVSFIPGLGFYVPLKYTF